VVVVPFSFPAGSFGSFLLQGAFFGKDPRRWTLSAGVLFPSIFSACSFFKVTFQIVRTSRLALMAVRSSRLTSPTNSFPIDIPIPTSLAFFESTSYSTFLCWDIPAASGPVLLGLNDPHLPTHDSAARLFLKLHRGVPCPFSSESLILCFQGKKALLDDPLNCDSKDSTPCSLFCLRLPFLVHAKTRLCRALVIRSSPVFSLFEQRCLCFFSRFRAPHPTFGAEGPCASHFPPPLCGFLGQPNRIPTSLLQFLSFPPHIPFLNAFRGSPHID